MHTKTDDCVLYFGAARAKICCSVFVTQNVFFPGVQEIWSGCAQVGGAREYFL